MSDTPRTDEMEKAQRISGIVTADFARQLERELVAESKDSASLRKKYADAMMRLDGLVK